MLDRTRLEAAEKRLGEAVLDPALWPALMDDICQGAGAVGAALLRSDVRTPDVPLTASVREYFANKYFADGLHIDDVRAIRGVPLLLAGKPVVVDQGRFVQASRRSALDGLLWLASRPTTRCGACRSSAARGKGRSRQRRRPALARFAARLTETATLSKAVGRRVLTGISNAFDLLGEPAIAINRMGNVIEANRSATALLDDDFRVRDQRIFVRELAARAEMDRFLERLGTTSDTQPLNADPIRIPRKSKRALLIRALAVDGAAKSPFLGARAIFSIAAPRSIPADRQDARPDAGTGAGRRTAERTQIDAGNRKRARNQCGLGSRSSEGDLCQDRHAPPGNLVALLRKL